MQTESIAFSRTPRRFLRPLGFSAAGSSGATCHVIAERPQTLSAGNQEAEAEISRRHPVGPLWELAKQTARAVGGIARPIEDIQRDSDRSIAAIGGITTTIQDVHQTSQTSASAVEEQSAAVNEIARNTVGTGQTAREISRTVAELTSCTAAVATGVTGLEQATRNASENSGHVSARVNLLRELLGCLNQKLG